MNKQIKIVDKGTTIIHDIPEDTPRVFSDGFGPALIGFPLTTVTLFDQQVVDPSEKAVHRKVTMTLQVPTLAILELAHNIQQTLQENKGSVEATLRAITTVLNKEI
jgi:hypothetical protein